MNATHLSSFTAEVPAYAQLQCQVHDALLAQHPEWILPDGACPTCDSYDERFEELLIQTLPTARRGLAQGNTQQFQFAVQYPSHVAMTHHIQ